jgi:hypothetical protein
MPLPLLLLLLDELVLVPVEALVPVFVLVLLLPQAAIPIPSATTASAVRPVGLILHPFTATPFIRTDGATLVRLGDEGQ